jgi:hypothetical protein
MDTSHILILVDVVLGVAMLLGTALITSIIHRISCIEAKVHTFHEQTPQIYATKDELRRSEDSLKSELSDFRKEVKDSFNTLFTRMDMKADKRKK